MHVMHILSWHVQIQSSFPHRYKLVLDYVLHSVRGEWAAENGHLETLKWICANGGKWTANAANWAAENGHLETLKWIRANGGIWTNAANLAAANGQLETLKWIRANGGKWTSHTANHTAINGH